MGHPRCPRHRNLEPKSAIPRADVHAGRLPEDRIDASAVGLLAVLCNARPRLRHAEPLRIQRRVSEASIADSARAVSASSGTSASTAVTTSTGTPAALAVSSTVSSARYLAA